MINEFYKKIENFKNDDNILSDSINKKDRILNNTSRVYNNLLKRYKGEYFEKYKQHNEEWEKKYHYKNFNDLTDDKIFNIDLPWMYNPQLYDEISQYVVDRHNKDKKSNELKSIQTFLDSITKGYIKNKNDVLGEFKTIKNNVKSENLKDIVKELELAIFGYNDDDDDDDNYDDDDDDDDDEEPKYEENIAERTKMRRQKDALRTFAQPDPDSDDLNEWIVYDKDGFDSNGYNKNGIKRDGYKKDGHNINGIKRDGYDKNVYNINGYIFLGLDIDDYNINGVEGVYDYKEKFAYDGYGYDKYGFDNNGYNRDGYNKYAFDNKGYNRDGYDKYGFNRKGLNKSKLNKYGKKNIPGSGLKILTPKQMLA